VANSGTSGRVVGWLAAGVVAAVVAATGTAQAGESGGDAAVAMTVNGVAISAGAVESEYRWIYNQKKIFHAVNDEQMAVLRHEAADRLVVWELVRQKLAAEGKAATPLEIDAKVAGDRTRIGDAFPKYLGTLGQDEVSFRHRTEGIQNFKTYQQAHIASQLKVSDEEVRDHYAKVTTYRTAEAYRVRYLQVSSVDISGRLMHGDLAAVAEKARKRVAEGTPLEEVAGALTNSQVTCRVLEGYYEVGKAPLYELALKPLVKSGDVSSALKVTDNSYLIFRLDEKVPAKNVSLEQARPEIERLLLEVKVTEAIPGHVAGLKKQAEIRYVDAKYAPGK